MSWSQVKLEEIFEIARGGSPRPISEFITSNPDGLNWISIKDASNSGKYITKTKQRIKKDGLAKSRLVKPGDFLLTNSMSFGRPYIMKTTGCIHDGWLVLCGDLERINQDYFYYLLGSDLLHAKFSKLAAGAVVKNLNINLVKGLKVPLPPLAEQKKIAAILDAADLLRQKDAQLIETYNALSQSLFLDMFGDPVTNPMEWEKSDAIKYCECIVPGRDKPKSFSGEVPWITTNDLNHLATTNSSKKSMGLSNSEIAEVRARVIPINSVILTCVGDLGIVSINSKPIVVNQQLHTFQCNEINISPVFMMHAISYQKPYMDKMSSSTTVPYMNKRICNKIPMFYPPITLQNQFAERIQAIEAQKQQAQASLQKSEELFNSLLQRAFKGELTA